MVLQFCGIAGDGGRAVDSIEQINRIKDYYGHQKHLNDVFGDHQAYAEGRLLYEMSHFLINMETHIRIIEHFGGFTLYTSYHSRYDTLEER